MLHVSSKTYERYEKQARVPRAQIERLAHILYLELETGGHTPLTLRISAPVTETEAEILARLDRIERQLD